MPLRLRVLAGPVSAQPAPPAERAVDVDEHLPEIRLGRRAGLEIELPFAALAPIHARLVRRGGAWIVEDLGAEGGTSVDGVALEACGARALAPGAVIGLAHIAVVFDGAGPARSGGEGTGTLARRLVSDLFGARGGEQAPRLICVAGWPSDQPQPAPLRLTVPERQYLVGRGEACDLVVPNDDVSREHAVIVRKWTGVHVRDLGSKNGVRVRGQPIAGEHRLHDGDRVELGTFELRIEDPEDRYLAAIERGEGERAQAAASAGTEKGRQSAPAGAESNARRERRRGGVAPIGIIVGSLVLLAIAAVVVALLVG